MLNKSFSSIRKAFDLVNHEILTFCNDVAKFSKHVQFPFPCVQKNFVNCDSISYISLFLPRNVTPLSPSPARKQWRKFSSVAGGAKLREFPTNLF